MTDNIIQMREPRAMRVRKALDAWYRATEEWIEKTLTLAIELKAARLECGDDDVRFGHWLIDNNCDDFLYKNERIALIHMADHLELSREVLRLTDRKSVRYIWENEIQPIVERRHLSLRGDRSDRSPENPKTQETASETPEKVESHATERPAETPPPESKLRKIVALDGWPRKEEVTALYREAKARTTLGRIPTAPSGKQIWKLLLQALDGGLLRENNFTVETLTARLLFPYGGNRSGRFLHQYDLTKAKDRNYVATNLLPRMIANKDALFADPDRIEELLAQAERARRATEQTAIMQDRVSKALAALAPGETEVIMFGKRMWPLVLGETVGTYDFRTLQVAIWKFTDLNRWLMLGDKSAHGRAIMIRNSTKWDRHLIGELTKGTEVAVRIDRIYSLVHALCSLMEQNPDGECREPMTPLVLG